jgi:lipid A 3-O-deacylase
MNPSRGPSASKACVLIAAFILFPLSNPGKTSAWAQPAPQEDPVQRSLGSSLWQFGGFAAGGFAPFDEVHAPPFYFSTQLVLANAGFEAGRMITRAHGPGILRGHGEAAIEIIPFWWADYPQQTITIYFPGTGEPPQKAALQPLRRYGVSITPVLFRWNFVRHEGRKELPWVQLGGGLLWTSQNFPIVPFITADTSRINFTPQVGIGESVFVRKRQSLDFAIKAVHISNANLGDNNPGVNVTLQFSAGYSWWK